VLDNGAFISETLRSQEAPVPNRRPISLTKLEGEVMAAVWDLPAPVRVREVADAVNAGRRPALAYTTVQSVLTILKGKGVVEQVRGEGRAHAFCAKVSRDQVSHGMVRELADRFFDGRVEPLLLQMIGQARMKPEELEELRSWVDGQLRDQEGTTP
jgi:BlaI family transcriptional regulator, penicillinase repressor